MIAYSCASGKEQTAASGNTFRCPIMGEPESSLESPIVETRNDARVPLFECHVLWTSATFL